MVLLAFSLILLHHLSSAAKLDIGDGLRMAPTGAGTRSNKLFTGNCCDAFAGQGMAKCMKAFTDGQPGYGHTGNDDMWNGWQHFDKMFQWIFKNKINYGNDGYVYSGIITECCRQGNIVDAVDYDKGATYVFDAAGNSETITHPEKYYVKLEAFGSENCSEGAKKDVYVECTANNNAFFNEDQHAPIFPFVPARRSLVELPSSDQTSAGQRLLMRERRSLQQNPGNTPHFGSDLEGQAEWVAEEAAANGAIGDDIPDINADTGAPLDGQDLRVVVYGFNGVFGNILTYDSCSSEEEEERGVYEINVNTLNSITPSKQEIKSVNECNWNRYMFELMEADDDADFWRCCCCDDMPAGTDWCRPKQECETDTKKSTLDRATFGGQRNLN